MNKFIVKKIKMIKSRDLDISLFHINVKKIKLK